MADRRPSPAAGIFGLVLALFGTLLFLDRTSIVDALRLLTFFWPAVVLVAGLWKLISPGSGASRLVGAGLTLFGGWWLASELGWLRLDSGLAFSLLLVFLGVALAWRGLRGGEPATARGEGSSVDAMAILGGAKRVSATRDFRGGDLFAVMGGVEIDLRGATIASSPAVLEVFVLWGGIDVRVPPTWAVEMRGVPILGGFDDRTASNGANDQRLVIKGFAIMGGVEVKS